VTALFIDTSFLIPLEAADDQFHTKASSFWQNFLMRPEPLVTTSFVIDEVATYFNSRGHHRKAIDIGRYLMTSPSVKLIYVDAAIFQESWRWLERHKDKRYSLTDCVSFVVMKQLKIKVALTFEKHFSQAGFQMLPGS
jgi:uncharacterized protein